MVWVVFTLHLLLIAGRINKCGFNNFMKKSAKLSEITSLQAFRLRHNFSYQQLSDLCGNVPNCSKSSIERLLKNQIEDKNIEAEIRKVLASNLPNFLLSLGISAVEIDAELSAIFTQGEYQPMINQRTILTPENYKYFGLTGDPFSKSPNSRSEVFFSPALKSVVDSVIDAIKFQGFCYVSGEIGSGKTVVRSCIEDYVAKDSKLRLIFPETFDMAKVNPANISRAILEEFDVKPIPSDSVARAKKVKNILARMYQEGVRVAIAFDECHRCNDATLSSMKNFLEMNSGGFQKYLGVVLFGQPSFEARLRDYRFREIVERITPIPMPDFNASAQDYLAHRLALVNGDIDSLFDTDAINLICRQAQTPLALGNIANSALIISRDVFDNKKVIGAAIKTKMYFTETEPKVLAMRKKA